MIRRTLCVAIALARRGCSSRAAATAPSRSRVRGRRRDRRRRSSPRELARRRERAHRRAARRAGPADRRRRTSKSTVHDGRDGRDGRRWAAPRSVDAGSATAATARLRSSTWAAPGRSPSARHRPYGATAQRGRLADDRNAGTATRSHDERRASRRQPDSSARTSSRRVPLRSRAPATGRHAQRARDARRSSTATVRAVGRVAWDESALHDVTMRVGGFAGDVEADALGAPVDARPGAVPVLQPGALRRAARVPRGAARERGARAATQRARARDADCVGAAERRLRLWGVDAGDIAAIARRGAPQEYLPGPRADLRLRRREGDRRGQRDRDGPARVPHRAARSRLDRGRGLRGRTRAGRRSACRRDVTLPLPARAALRRDGRVRLSVAPGRSPHRARAARARESRAARCGPTCTRRVSLRAPLGARLTVPDSAVLRAGETQLRVPRSRRRAAAAAARRDRHRERRPRRDPLGTRRGPARRRRAAPSSSPARAGCARRWSRW